LLHDVKFKSTDNQLGVNDFFLMVSAQRRHQGGHQKVCTNLKHLHLKMQVFYKK
jgi:hypothetical protein